jgi:hypothetical protein
MTSDTGVLTLDHLLEDDFIIELHDDALSFPRDNAYIKPPKIPSKVEFPRRVVARGKVQRDGEPVTKLRIGIHEFQNADGSFEVRGSPGQHMILRGDFEDVLLKLNAQPGQVVDLGVITVKRKAAKEAPREAQ